MYHTQFLDVGNALRANTPEPTDMPKGVEPILEALSKDEEVRLDEISAVIVVAEAADEFPQHILRKIIELEEDKRALLKKVVS